VTQENVTATIVPLNVPYFKFIPRGDTLKEMIRMAANLQSVEDLNLEAKKREEEMNAITKKGK
jgi:hypothetical protein